MITSPYRVYSITIMQRDNIHDLEHCFCVGVILVTDGVCGFVGSGVMNTLVGQMRRSNISCWALLVGGSPSPMCW